MAMETVTLKIEKARGYSGNRSAKSYIAQITGTSKQYIWAREFVDTEAVDAEEFFQARRKGKGTWLEAAAVGPGLYERTQYGERSYLIVWLKEDGNAAWSHVPEDRAGKMALLMDEGKTYEEARLATKKPAKSEQTTKEPTEHHPEAQ